MVLARNFGSSICLTTLLMKIIIESFAVKNEQNRETFGKKLFFCARNRFIHMQYSSISFFYFNVPRGMCNYSR